MNVRAREYQVFMKLRDPAPECCLDHGELPTARQVELDAETPALAAKSAEISLQCYQAVMVAQQIAGRCGKCQCYIFAGDPIRLVRGHMLCEACY